MALCASTGTLTLGCWEPSHLAATTAGDVATLFPEAAPQRALLCATLSSHGASLAASGAGCADGWWGQAGRLLCRLYWPPPWLPARPPAAEALPHRVLLAAGEAVLLGEHDLLAEGGAPLAAAVAPSHRPPPKWSPIHVWQRGGAVA